MEISKTSIDTSDNTPHWQQVGMWFFIIVAWGLWTTTIILSVFYTSWSLYDYSAYYHAAHRLNQGMAINLSIEAETTYLYPPLLVQLLSPLEASMSFTETAIVWTLLNILCLILSIILLASQIQSHKKRYIIWLLPIFFIPTFETYLFGQVVPILLLLLAGVMVAYKHKYFALIGLLLAIATWVKIYPIILIFYFVLRQEWRVVIWAFVFGMALLFFQISLSGTDVLINYFTTTLVDLASKGQDFNLFHNHSLLGALRKILEDASFVSIVRLVMIVAMLITMFWASNGKKHEKLNHLHPTQFELEYSIAIIFMLLIGSTLHASGMLPLLVAMIIAIQYGKSSKIYGILCTIYLALGLTFFLVYKDIFYDSPPLLQGFGFYVMFALWGLMVYLRWTAKDLTQ